MKKILPGGLIILAALIAGLFVGNLLFHHQPNPVREQSISSSKQSSQHSLRTTTMS